MTTKEWRAAVRDAEAYLAEMRERAAHLTPEENARLASAILPALRALIAERAAAAATAAPSS